MIATLAWLAGIVLALAAVALGAWIRRDRELRRMWEEQERRKRG